MRICLRRFTVRGPAGVGNTGTANQRLLICGLRQISHFANATQTRHVPLTIDDRQTG